MERMTSLFLFCFGLIAFPPNTVRGRQQQYSMLKPQNVTNVAPQQREFVAGALAVGNVLISSWSSLWSDKGIEIDITNHMMTSLNDPTWYMLHGHAAILPPFLINGNEPTSKINFFRKPNSAYGTEGAVAYQINSYRRTPRSLVVMWKVPQLVSMGFYVKIERGTLTGRQLKKLFDIVDDDGLWFRPEKLNEWKTGTNQGITWKAAMGTKSLTTLRIAVM